MKLVLAVFLAAHALIHVSYLTPAPPQTAGGPAWPFQADHSWLITRFGLDPTLVRSLAVVLVAATIAAFLAAGLATLGWLSAAWWPGLVVLGAALSLTTLTVFFHPWLLLGIAIDVVVLLATVVGGWTPSALDT